MGRWWWGGGSLAVPRTLPDLAPQAESEASKHSLLQGKNPSYQKRGRCRQQPGSSSRSVLSPALPPPPSSPSAPPSNKILIPTNFPSFFLFLFFSVAVAWLVLSVVRPLRDTAMGIASRGDVATPRINTAFELSSDPISCFTLAGDMLFQNAAVRRIRHH